MRPPPFSSALLPLLGKKKKGSGGSSASSYDKRASSYDKRSQKSSSSSSTALTDRLDKDFMFSLMGVTKKLPGSGRVLLDDVSLSFFPGAKIGVVGPNGAGKSTLLKVMAGLDAEFDGEARPLPGARIGYLPQEPALEGETVADCIRPAVAASQALLDEYNDLSVKIGEGPEDMDKLMERFSALQDQIDARDLWELDRAVARATEALRCPPGSAAVATLSGGEKRRVALACLLLQNHDLLLLDEPTNHLDAESVAWLETFLAKFEGTVVAITHDRYFLENVAEWILELDKGKGYPHEGCYSGWLEEKQKRIVREKQEETAASKILSEELEWIRSTPKAKGNKSKARLGRYEELLAQSNQGKDSFGRARVDQIFIPAGPRLGDVVVDFKGVTKSFGAKQLLSGADFSLPPGAIVGVVGPNGAGKTTLVKMILGDEQPDSGEVNVGSTVKITAVRQERMEGLEGDKTAWADISDELDEIELGAGVKMNSRAYCSLFGLKSGLQQTKVKELSGGERNRCLLAKAVKSGANFIILDEPTNDLDTETIRSLENALLDFAGCALVVSHDRYFLDKIATHILAFENDSKITLFQGNWGEYNEDRVARLGDDAPRRPTFAPLM
ncbi:hypothetical protein TeGR_g15089 [Tetraparma gracilis]|uniref:ABC transporter domain-containing protein n=1 Tax=Tetraparma gracilis TaxID=2962635 RepID=A0ABQ6M3C6_9STRA|nr:hypothetical protein TeGR_g15089 [Tetraparma gracilis]